MATSDSTCWTLVRSAASGRKRDREDFVRLYAPLVRSYLTARWTGTSRLDDLDDAVQDVFLDCFRDGGVLERCERDRPGGFRAFLYGVTRVIALRLERSEARRDAGVRGDIDLERIEHDAPSLSRVFDRAWATSLLREASLLLARRAEDRGEEALRRVKLLRARFEEGLPIREIASLWNADPARLHKEYAQARREFRQALCEVVALHHPGSPAEVERKCAELIDLLG
jgi:RNA polymerase sigma-70 factor (ECF subfamily)